MNQHPPALARYFDYNGSTPLALPVRELCSELLEGTYGNSVGTHPTGGGAAEVG